MKDKKIRVLCAVTSLVSILAIVPIMFAFFKYSLDSVMGGYSYSVWGYRLYLDTDNPINIVVGVFGFVALLWDLVYGAYALIDGRYRNLTWRIARYGYFYGIAIGLINFAFILSFIIGNNFYAFSIIFLVLIAVAVILKFFLIFIKDEDTKNK